MRVFPPLLLLALLLPLPVSAASQPCSAAPGSSSQLGVVEEAYNLLSTMYVDRLQPDELLTPAVQAVHDQLTKDTADATVVSASAASQVADWPTFASQYCVMWSEDSHVDSSHPLAYEAIHAMARAVDEGHTRFLTPEMYREHQAWATGDMRYDGIGARLQSNPLSVEYVFPGSPAEQAGLAYGDDIVAIDGQPAADFSSTEAVAKLRGDAGTAVRLTVQRQGVASSWDVGVQRASIRLPMVEAQVVDHIGVMRLRGFPTTDLPGEVASDLSSFKEQGVQGLVLDLRGNSGGRLDVGVEIASAFLPPSTPVYRETSRRGQTTTATALGARIWDGPMTVLVDEGTASMGEILAAALQEQGVATVVGSTSAGSVAGSVVVPLGDGSALQITTLRIDSGLGAVLNHVGVHPDVNMAFTLKDSRTGKDPTLDSAMDLLRTKLGYRPQ